MNSKLIYQNMCHSRQHLRESYRKYSGLHKHHIIPKHSGGEDKDSNYTYLTVREHIIAHYLLWRIYRNPNDLRSMKMLGAKLSVTYRREIGIFCKENKIGFHKATKEQLSAWCKKGLQKQKESGDKNTFYYWSTEEGRKQRASMGGKASIISGNNKEFKFWSSKEGRKQRASMGGKAHTGKRCMFKPGDNTFIRVSPERVDEFIKNGYIFGSPIVGKTKGTKTNIPSVRRKKVSDGKIIYDSVHDAALKNNVTPSAIVYRCKSRKSTWQYVYDNES